MAVDVLAVRRGEVAGEVGEPLLERVDVVDLVARAAERARDVVEDLGVHAVEEQRVERAELVEGVELVDHAGGIGAHAHVELFHVLDVEVLPELVGGLGQVVLTLQDTREARGERAVEVDVAKHVPGVMTTHGGSGDAPLAVGGEAPLPRGALGVLSGIVGAPDVGLEDVLGEVIVTRAHVGVGEAIPHEPQRGVVVARGILVVDDEAHAVLLGQVEELLLLVAEDDGYVGDSRLAELADLALDEHLAAYPDQALGALVGHGGEARGESCGHDDGIVDAVGREGGAAGRGDAAAGEEAEPGELAAGGVDASQRQAAAPCRAALARLGVLEQVKENLELLLREVYDGLLTRSLHVSDKDFILSRAYAHLTYAFYRPMDAVRRGACPAYVTGARAGSRGQRNAPERARHSPPGFATP